MNNKNNLSETQKPIHKNEAEQINIKKDNQEYSKFEDISRKQEYYLYMISMGMYRPGY
ncbi:hypothetical protein LJC18_03820 [Lachnospiraceae bacterium OttesenSCG-928-E19]|nr:hypothetical protein [Lachnospiraceae bacterium OttesenSCG-928-E19]